MQYGQPSGEQQPTTMPSLQSYWLASQKCETAVPPHSCRLLRPVYRCSLFCRPLFTDFQQPQNGEYQLFIRFNLAAQDFYTAPMSFMDSRRRFLSDLSRIGESEMHRISYGYTQNLVSSPPKSDFKLFLK